MRTPGSLCAARIALASLALSGCGTNFDPPSLVESVRLLAIRADKPYAAPGDTVTMTALVYDNRKPPQPPEVLLPMQVYWAPKVCNDPLHDSYYNCYAFPASPGADVTSSLMTGTTFSFSVWDHLIDMHQPSSGYGVAFVFAIACAGNVHYLGVNTGTVPFAPPLGCFDDTTTPPTKLGSDDSVFAYAQIFSFADGRTNAIPQIDHLTFGGVEVDAMQGIPVAACPATGRCASTALDTIVPSSSWELDPADLSRSGTPLHEEIWVNYFVSKGSVADSALLYDATTGKIPNSAVQYTAPTEPGEQMLWAVVRDNRGGVNWLQVPLHVQ
jgi:hypothetical protein